MVKPILAILLSLLAAPALFHVLFSPQAGVAYQGPLAAMGVMLLGLAMCRHAAEANREAR